MRSEKEIDSVYDADVIAAYHRGWNDALDCVEQLLRTKDARKRSNTQPAGKPEKEGNE